MKIMMKKISMIALFHNKECPIPLKFGILRPNKEPFYLRVGSIIHWEYEKKAGIPAYLFQCVSIIDHREIRYELKFIIPSSCWYLYKI
ncbi:MAG: hypothetical protein Q4P28_00265 [Tissierellia bacterium]|nr:hypothetical protein [Tissierellia bacterium]